jgi:D-alanyl-D-alanine dipeptidase
VHDANEKTANRRKDAMTSNSDARELLVGLLLGAGLALLSACWWIWASHG